MSDCKPYVISIFHFLFILSSFILVTPRDLTGSSWFASSGWTVSLTLTTGYAVAIRVTLVTSTSTCILESLPYQLPHHTSLVSLMGIVNLTSVEVTMNSRYGICTSCFCNRLYISLIHCDIRNCITYIRCTFH